MIFSLLNNKKNPQLFSMHTPCVNSKNLSDYKDKKSFTLAAVTDISGKSLMVFAAVSQLHSPNPTWFLTGCRDKVGGGWETSAYVDYTS